MSGDIDENDVACELGIDKLHNAERRLSSRVITLHDVFTVITRSLEPRGTPKVGGTKDSLEVPLKGFMLHDSGYRFFTDLWSSHTFYLDTCSERVSRRILVFDIYASSVVLVPPFINCELGFYLYQSALCPGCSVEHFLKS